MKKAKGVIVILLVFGLVLHPTYTQAQNIDAIDLFNFLKILDLEQCLLKSYRCEPFGCGMFPPEDRICHNYPAGFVETPTAPFTTVIPFLSWLLTGLMNTMGPWAGAGGSGASGGSYDTHLKYFEAHVFDLPTRTFIKLRYPFLKLCYWGSVPFEINYLSELDAVNWRTGIADYFTFDFLFGAIAQISQICTITSIGDNLGDAIGVPINIGGNLLDDVCMGTWGVTYPRVGFCNAESEPVASAIAAYRASRVTTNPLMRIVLMPKIFDSNVKMQLGYPYFAKPLNCFTKGATPLVWDNFDTKLPKGAGYIWVLWERKCCCIPATGCLGLPPFL